MRKLFIYPYIGKSKSVFALCKELGAKQIRLKNSVFEHSPDKLVVNWGSRSKRIRELGELGQVINPFKPVDICARKDRFFKALAGSGLMPDYTVDPYVAKQWSDEGQLVVSRTELSSHSGKGILFSDKHGDWLDKGKLFVKYVPKKHEFRVHVFNGKIIDIQQKKMKLKDAYGEDVRREDVNWRVRSHKNGFVYARKDLIVPECVKQVAVQAFEFIPNLNFGAMDVIYSEKQDRAYVLECNTAPGLTGTTLDNYVETIRDLL